MMKVYSWAGTAAGILSLVLLAKLGFDLGIAAPLQLVLDYYEAVVSFLLGWLEPHLESLVIHVGPLLDVELQLESHWKHVLVLMWLYIGNDVRIEIARRRSKSAAFAAIFGGTLALASAVASGLLPLDHESRWPVIFPILGFVLYGVVRAAESATFFRQSGKTWWQTFRHMVWRFPFADAVIGTSLIAASGVADGLGYWIPNLALLLIFVALIALKNVIQGAMHTSRSGAQDWNQRFFSLATSRLGVQIFVVIGGCVLFLLCSAGLSLAGL